ncbi:hypothetical protein BCR39DRAFT_503741 [Naematelia encephala]|uniref:PIN domain-containing protein n=1 Tax=Naematelia encephala TaxID=71784 RepID=A0A1Y2BH62_9TREE|nr:hypothetical protein BCR39DRAFT_503741 [Naematelia encephala]
MELITDDVDMDDAEWSYQTHWATTSLEHVIPGQRSALVDANSSVLQDVHYLAVDTNILISHFPLFKSMYTHLAVSNKTAYNHLAPIDKTAYTRLAQPDDESTPLVLLIPYTVINELDGLGSRGSDDETLGIAARTATAFLLDVQRNQTSTKRKILHCQRWSERNDSSDRTGIESGEKEAGDEGDMEIELDLQAMQDYRHGKASFEIPHDSRTTTTTTNTNTNGAIRPDIHDDMLIDQDITTTTTTTTRHDSIIDLLADIPLPSRIPKANQRRPPQSLIDDFIVRFVTFEYPTSERYT